MSVYYQVQRSDSPHIQLLEPGKPAKFHVSAFGGPHEGFIIGRYYAYTKLRPKQKHDVRQAIEKVMKHILEIAMKKRRGKSIVGVSYLYLDTYRLLRSRGIPARSAYETLMRRDRLAIEAAAELVDRYGRDGAEIVLRGAIAAPFGVDRVMKFLDIPYPEYDLRRRVGFGLSASATLRWLSREVLPAIRYV